MFQALLGPIAGLAKTWVEGRVAKSQALVRIKVAEAESQRVIKEKQATGVIDWDHIQAAQAADSWKDEWLTVVFTAPLVILLFGGDERVSNFFAALETTPDWYQYLLGTIVAASFGFRGITKFMGKGK